MGTKSGSNPVAELTLILCFLLVLLLGVFKVAFTTLAASPSGVGRMGSSMVSKTNWSDSMAAAFFDSTHAISVGFVAVVAVP